LGEDKDVEAAMATIRAKLLAKHDAMAAAVRAVVVPVSHTISVVPQ
jgi:hypothetical protein